MGQIYLTRRHRRVSPVPGFDMSGQKGLLCNILFGVKAVAFVLLCALSIIPLHSQAQWKFNMNLQVNGRCEGLNATIKATVQGAYDHYWNSLPAMIPTKDQCESLRAVINGYSASGDGCTVRIICTPCTGRDMAGMAGAVAGDVSYLNNYQLGGIDKGMASFSTNPNDEIAQWENEFDRKTETFAYFNGASAGLGFVATDDAGYNEMYASAVKDASNDGIFLVRRGVAPKERGIYIGEGKFKGIDNSESSPVDEKKIDKMLERVEMSIDDFISKDWHSAEEMESYIQSLFKGCTNLSIRDIIMAMKSRTLSREEQQVLMEYNAFKEKYYTKADAEFTKKIDNINTAENHYALLAENVYKNKEDENYQPGNDIFRIDKDNKLWPDDLALVQKSKLDGLLDGVEMLNKQGKEMTGFSAALYYDEKLKEFVVAFRGTDPTDIADIIADIQNAAGQLTHQYGGANALRRVLKEASDAGLKISIVGHSLGGGLASVLGLATGLPTYTYNAAGVSDSVLKRYGILNNKDNVSQNITAYFSNNDVLSNVQDATSIPTKIKAVADFYASYTEEHPIIGAALPAVGSAAAPNVAPVVVAKTVMNPSASIDAVTTMISAAKNTPPALGKRINIGDAGLHSIKDMKNNFADFERTYRSSEWKKLTNSRSKLSEAKEIDTQSKMIVKL